MRRARIGEGIAFGLCFAGGNAVLQALDPELVDVSAEKVNGLAEGEDAALCMLVRRFKRLPFVCRDEPSIVRRTCLAESFGRGTCASQDLPDLITKGDPDHSCGGAAKQEASRTEQEFASRKRYLLHGLVASLSPSRAACQSAEFSLSYIFISHDLNVVRHVSDEVVVMYLGQVIERAPAVDLYAAPAHPYTRALLASMPSHDPDRRTTTPPLTGDPPSPIDLPPGCRFAPRCPLVADVCITRAPALLAQGRHACACHLADASSGHPGVGAAA